MDFLKRILKGDLTIWMVYILLVLISMVSMFSASFRLIGGGSIGAPIAKHSIMLGLGFVAMYITMNLRREWIRGGGWALLLLSWVLLIATLIFGEIGGSAARSLSLFGFSIQPSEFARLAIILVMSDLICRFQEKLQKRSFADPVKAEKGYFFSMLALFAITVVLIVSQALSTTVLLCVTLVAMVIYGGFSWRILLRTGFVIGALVFVIAATCVYSAKQGHYDREYIENANVIQRSWLKMTSRSETWIARFDHFGDEDLKYVITDKNIQEANAAIAIAKGRKPCGPGNSIQRKFLPNADNDFIFAIIVEESGVYGAIIIMLLYWVLIFRCFQIAWKAEHIFDSVMVMSLSFIILLQAIMHIAISVDFMPVTGQSLPLIGRGGSSIIIISAYLGLTQGVARKQHPDDEEAQKEDREEQERENKELEAEAIQA